MKIARCPDIVPDDSGVRPISESRHAGTVSAGFAQQRREARHVPRDRSMELGRGAVVVRIPAGDDAAAARAATARSEKCIRKADTVRGEPIDVGRARGGISVAAEIVPTDIVADDEDDIRAFRGVERKRQQ